MKPKERIRIEPFEIKYLQDYFSEFNGRITAYQWPEPFESIEAAKEVLQCFIREMDREKMLFFAILTDTGRFIGSVEIHGLDGACPELGIWITEREQGRGYAYAALCNALKIARTRYGKNAFFYEADIRSKASIGLLHKLENDYNIVDREIAITTTDSGKELKLQGHILKAKQSK